MKPIRKSAAVAALALSIMCTAGMARAATTPVSFGGGSSASVSDSNIAANSSFNDYFTFTLPSYATGGCSAYITVGTSTSISNMLLEQLVSPGVYTAPTAAGFMQTGLQHSGTQYAFGFSGLAQNVTYALNVAGTTSSAMGVYNGQISLNVAPVPEPGEWLLMLVGLGLVGLMAGRSSGRSGVGFAA